MAGDVLPALPEGVTQKAAGAMANSFRIAAVADRLAAHLQFGGVANPADFLSLCLSLARGMDYAVANNEVPSSAQKLPKLLKEICQRKGDLFLQAAIMVLMISAKNACKFGWFIAKDAEEISSLANEIGTSFCSQGDVNAAFGDSHSVVDIIMSRYYPFMKMGQILVSLEVKPGYGAYLVDFHLSKNTKHSPQEKIRLFVAQVDNTETSGCIVSPQQVNFLLNGKGVERRTNVLMDTGPQLPSNVTSMLKYGTNLLQAVGQFSGHFLVIVAFMSTTPLPSTPVLQDYAQSNVAASDPDADIIEGPSRVSLNCPISCTRIRTPVKGQSCKHLQCFDFRNYVDINSRRPSWRCPHCNQHVCYPDLRVDQNMVKVLKEVGGDVADVIISDDGSWKAVDQSDDIHNEKTGCQNELPKQQEHDSSPPTVMDLTDDNRMDVDTSDNVDKKPSQASLGSQPVDSHLTMQSLLDNAVTVDQDDFWSTIDPDIGSGINSSGPGVQPIHITPEPAPRNFMTSPLTTTHSLSTPLRHDIGSQGNNSYNYNTVSMVQNLVSGAINLQGQQSHQLVSNIEYGSLSQVPRNVSRSPIAIQALPAAPAQRPRTHLHSTVANGSSIAAQASVSSPQIVRGLNANSNTFRPPQFSRSNLNPLQSSMPLHQSTSQAASRPSTAQVASALRAASGPRTEAQNPQHQHIRRPHFPSPGLTQPAVHVTRHPPLVPVQLEPSRGGSINSNSNGMRTPLMPHRSNVATPQQAGPGADSVVDVSSDNWRPTGRMRGSITSQAAAAYGDMVIRATTQTAPSSQPLPQPGSSPLPPNVPASLQAFLANSRSRNFYASQAQSGPMSQPGSTNGGSGTPP